MQQESSHWCLSTSPINVVSKSSWLLMPAIIILLAFDVFESSVIAAHGDNSLVLFGFLIPLITLLSAIAIAVAVRTNMELVRQQNATATLIPSLLAFSILIGSALMLFLVLAKNVYLDLLDASAWLLQFDNKLQTLYSSEIDILLNYKIYSLISLILVWQLSSMFRVIGQYKLSGFYLFCWMAFKTLWLIFNIDHQSIFLISSIGKMHFYIDTAFAVLGVILLIYLKPLNFSKCSLKSVMNEKRRALLLTIQQLAPALSLTLLTAVVSRFDQGYVAAFALLFRIEAFLLLIPMIFTASIPTVVGICYWAGDKVRCRNVLTIAFLGIVIFQLVIALAVLYWQYEIVASLCPNSLQKLVVTEYLTILPFSYVFLGITLLVPSCLNAIGEVVKSSAIIMIHRFMLIPFLACIGLSVADHFGLFIGLFTAHICIFLYLVWQNRQRVMTVFTQNRRIKVETETKLNIS